MKSRALLAALAPLSLVSLLACGGAPKQPAAAAPSTTTTRSATAAAPTKEAQPSNVVRRSVLHDVLTAGPGALLQHVSVDDHPVFVGGKFHGFRITALDAQFFTGVDLKPGDVITGVNGFTIERPEDALEVFKSLEVASEIRVSYERDGTPRELRYGVDEDAGSALPPPASSAPGSDPSRPPPASPAAPAAPGRGVKVIR